MSREHQHAEASAVLVQWESQTHVYTFYFVTYEQNDSRSAATCLQREERCVCLVGERFQLRVRNKCEVCSFVLLYNIWNKKKNTKFSEIFTSVFFFPSHCTLAVLLLNSFRGNCSHSVGSFCTLFQERGGSIFTSLHASVSDSGDEYL